MKAERVLFVSILAKTNKQTKKKKKISRKVLQRLYLRFLWRNSLCVPLVGGGFIKVLAKANWLFAWELSACQENIFVKNV